AEVLACPFEIRREQMAPKQLKTPWQDSQKDVWPLISDIDNHWHLPSPAVLQRDTRHLVRRHAHEEQVERACDLQVLGKSSSNHSVVAEAGQGDILLVPRAV